MKTQRRDFCKHIAMTVGMGGLVASTLPPLKGQVSGPEGQVGGIYQLQAAFHRTKTTQDIDLMMSLWDVDGVLNNQGDANSPYIGFDKLKSFWLNSGSFKNRRFSLVPSFKIMIDIHGDLAWLYFECHDLGDFDLDTRAIAADTFLAGMVGNVSGSWVFKNMTAGRAFPLSATQYYFPI